MKVNTSNNMKVSTTDVFRTLPNIYDEVFVCENRLLVVHH